MLRPVSVGISEAALQPWPPPEARERAAENDGGSLDLQEQYYVLLVSVCIRTVDLQRANY